MNNPEICPEEGGICPPDCPVIVNAVAAARDEMDRVFVHGSSIEDSYYWIDSQEKALRNGLLRIDGKNSSVDESKRECANYLRLTVCELARLRSFRPNRYSKRNHLRPFITSSDTA